MPIIDLLPRTPENMRAELARHDIAWTTLVPLTGRHYATIRSYLKGRAPMTAANRALMARAINRLVGTTLFSESDDQISPKSA
jgi:hypothetical protein